MFFSLLESEIRFERKEQPTRSVKAQLGIAFWVPKLGTLYQPVLSRVAYFLTGRSLPRSEDVPPGPLQVEVRMRLDHDDNIEWVKQWFREVYYEPASVYKAELFDLNIPFAVGQGVWIGGYATAVVDGTKVLMVYLNCDILDQSWVLRFGHYRSETPTALELLESWHQLQLNNKGVHGEPMEVGA